MPYYIQSGSTFTVTDQNKLSIFNKIPVGNFIIQKDANGEFYLNKVDNFQSPDKVYGTLETSRDRIMSTFFGREVSTGVMLNGEKGSGKTLLAKLLSLAGYTHSMPTIIINAPWKGDAFNKFIQDIDQPCIILFDEFEKVYDHDDQEAILTLLDGVFPSQKLYIFTCNDKWRVDGHMRNRPGRIYYMIDFAGVDENCIREYCKEKLKNLSYLENLVKLSGIFADFNFDMLKALVEEMNRYNESPQDALKMLNVKPEFSGTTEYKVVFTTVDHKEIVDGSISPTVWRGNPLNNKNISVDYCTKEDNEDNNEWYTVEFGINDLHNFDSKNGIFSYVYKGNNLQLVRVEHSKFDYRGLL